MQRLLRRSSVALALWAACWAKLPGQSRFRENPLVSLESSPTLGDNINGPSVIRVPRWIAKPLGRYYLYFAHHKGDHIRLAYADSLHGPWKIYEPGVLPVSGTIFYRPQPDPAGADMPYTHVASPEVFIDQSGKRLVMYVHGMWTDGKRWPEDPRAAQKWLAENGYAQYTQTAVSHDGLHFEAQPGITARTSYLRVFKKDGEYFSMSRLGVLGRAADPLAKFELGPSAFENGPYARRVRHVALVARGKALYVFFSAIGDAPEKILLSTVRMEGDWHGWKASAPIEVLTPRERYECVDLPVVPSKVGEAEGKEHALRDPAVFEENGKVWLFYSVCGEQGIGAAEVTGLIR